MQLSAQQELLIEKMVANKDIGNILILVRELVKDAYEDGYEAGAEASKSFN